MFASNLRLVCESAVSAAARAAAPCPPSRVWELLHSSRNWLARVKTCPLSFYHCLFLYNYGPPPPRTLCSCFDPPTPFSSSSLGAHVGVMGLVEVHVGQRLGAYGHQLSSGWALSWAPWGTPRDMGVGRRLPPTGCPHQGSEAPCNLREQ